MHINHVLNQSVPLTRPRSKRMETSLTSTLTSTNEIREGASISVSMHDTRMIQDSDFTDSHPISHWLTSQHGMLTGSLTVQLPLDHPIKIDVHTS